MASWFTRALDTITPWDRAGELQRRQEKKKKEEQLAQAQQPKNTGGLRVTTPRSSSQVSVDNRPQVQRPQDLFKGINSTPSFSNPSNKVNVTDNSIQDYQTPTPGSIVKPTVEVSQANPRTNIQLPNGGVSNGALTLEEQTNQSINRGLDAGKSWEQIAKENKLDLNYVRDYSRATRPNYGMKIARPKDSLRDAIKSPLSAYKVAFGRFTDLFNANSQADQYRRQQGNAVPGAVQKNIITENPGNIVSKTPLVGHAIKALNTLGAQGAQLGQIAELQPYLIRQRDLTNKMEEAQKQGNMFTLQSLKVELDKLNAEIAQKYATQRAASTNFQKNKGGLLNVGTLYDAQGAQQGDAATAVKDVALPTAVAVLDAYTLGKGNLISEGLKGGIPEVGTRAALRQELPNIVKAGVGNYASGDLGARSEGADNTGAVKAGLLNSILGTIPDVGLPTLLNSMKTRLLPKLVRGGNVAGDIAQETGDAAASVGGEIASTPRQIPIKQINDIPVRQVDSMAQPINVRNLTEPKPLIQDVSGGASVSTPDALIKQTAQDVQDTALRTAAFDQAKTAPKPNPAIEGVIPRPPTETFKLDATAVADAQDKVVKDYAVQLRQLGEGNGVSLIPDGQGGYTRMSSNVRDPSLKGKRMTKAAWIDEATRQLQGGVADPAFQQAFNDISSPDVQSLLAKGDQTATPPVGKPIAINQLDVQGKRIPVMDNTNMPTNLPETPGQVRVTTQTSPNNVKSTTVATQTPAPAEPVKAKQPPVSLASPDSSTTGFLKDSFNNGVGQDLARAARSLRDLKKLRKLDKSQRAAMAQKAYESVLANGGTQSEAEAALRNSLGGEYAKAEYQGRGFNFDTPDGKRLTSIIDQFYAGRTFDAMNTRESFNRLFNYGTEGGPNVLQPGDVKRVRRFFNQMVPDANLGDGVEQAIRDAMDETVDTGGKVKRLLGLQRSLKFTADVGSIMRQSQGGGFIHPINWAKSIKEGFGAMFNPSKYDDIVKSFESDRYANYMSDRLGVDLTMLKGGEEQFRNADWAKKIPGVNKVVDASERFFNVQTNKLRYYNAKGMIDTAGGIAELEKVASDTSNPDAFLKAIGSAGNTITGRGQVGKLGAPEAAWLNEVFTSPKGLAARVQRLNPKWYYDLMKTNPMAGKEAIKSLVVQSAVTASALGAAAATGHYENGKIRVGNTRYDITGGVASIFSTLNDIHNYMTGATKTTPFANAEDEATKWFKNQLTPGINMAFGMIGYHPNKNGQFVDRYGNPFDPTRMAIDNLAPVNVAGLYNDLKSGTPIGQTVANAALDTGGINANTYQTAEDKNNAARAKTAPEANASMQALQGTGLLDKSFVQTLPAEIQDLINGKKQITPEEVTRVKTAMVRGVSSTGEDTAYLERGQYDTNLAALKLKKELMSADNTTKPSDLVKMDVAIKRGQIYKDNKIPYDMINSYKSTSLTDWRNMGDKESGSYNPEMYQRLWEMDQKMTKGGVSYGESLDTGKYYLSKNGSGSGGSSKKGIGTDFGRLSSASAPTVRSYQTIDVKSGSVPVISRVRPNIVHKISANR